MSTEQKVIKHKVGLLRLAEELGNVSRACKVMGYSRDTFYRYKQAVDEGGFEALVEASRRKPNLRNRIASEIEEAVVALALKEPALGQLRSMRMGLGVPCLVHFEWQEEAFAVAELELEILFPGRPGQ